MSPRGEAVAWASVTVLLAATLFEALVAVEIVPLGDVPGEGARGGGIVFAAALVAMLAGAALALALALAPPATHAPSLVWMLAPSGAAYVTARWLTFDPYYLPTLRRYSDGGVGAPWIAGLALSGAISALLVRRNPRSGAVATSCVLPLSALTAWVLGFGK